MWRLTDPLPFSNRLLFIFAFPLGIWVIVSLASVVMLQRALESYEQLERSQRVVLLANEYRSMPEVLRNLERVFLTTSAPDALTGRTRKFQEANQLHGRLLAAVRNEPAQVAKLETASERLQEWYYDVSSRRIRQRADTVAEELSDAVLRRAPVLINDFLEAMDAFIDTEEESLNRYRAAIDMTGALVQWIIWTGLVLGALSMVSVIVWISRRIAWSMKEINVATEELAKGNMAARVTAGGRSNELAQRFNAMADLIQRRNRELTVLAELGELLNSCSTIDEAVRIFAHFGDKLFPDKPGALYFVETGKTEVQAVSYWGGGEEHTGLHMAFEDCWALRLGRAHHSQPEGNTRCSHLLRLDSHVRCTPLPAFGEIIGILSTVENGATGKEYGRHYADMVAQQIALAFANVRLREMLRHQAIRDPLTQLFNRRHLDEVMRLEIYRAGRHEQPLSLLIFDIDHFKEFNDTYGHDGGDAILKCMGETLQEFFRPEDSAFRYGGEEFVVLLPGTSKEDAVDRAEELRGKVAELRITHGNALLPAVTISLGVATWPDDGSDAERLLNKADKALYHAKHTGRNRVIAADGPSDG